MTSDDRWTVEEIEEQLACAWPDPDNFVGYSAGRVRALLLTALDALQAQPRWVAFADRKPPDAWVGLAMWEGRDWRTIEWLDGCATPCCRDHRNAGEPTHWLSGVPWGPGLPPLPEEDADD